MIYGSVVNFLYDIYKYEFYGVDLNIGCIDYDVFEVKVKECRLKFIIVGVSLYLRLIDYERILKVVKEVGVYFMVDMVYVVGLVVVKVIFSFVFYVDFVFLFMIKIFCGLRSGIVFCKVEYVKKFDKGVFLGILGFIYFNIVVVKVFLLLYLSIDKFKKIME